MASSSSSTTKKYDVFLNFRGSDTRNRFTTHLKKTLALAGINFFIDDKLKRGEEISPSLVQSIESSRISVVIFSEDYASSCYCLDELAKIIECRESMGQVVIPVFYRVEPSDVGELRGSYGKAFAKHEAKFKNNKEKLEKWTSALQKARVLSGWPIKTDEDEANCVTKIVINISQKLSEEKMAVIASTLEELAPIEVDMKSRFEHLERESIERQKVDGWLAHIGSIKDDVQSLQRILVTEEWTTILGASVQRLMNEVSELIPQKGQIEKEILASYQTNPKPLLTESLEAPNFQINMAWIMEGLTNNEVSSIGICGMGGVGKTTLATHVHNKLLEQSPKFAHVYWVDVSQVVNVQKLQSLIAKVIKINLKSDDDERKRAAILSKELNKRQNFVLILDDVWNHFDAGEVGVPIDSNGCKLIVTTRSLEVCWRSNCKRLIKVEPLNAVEAWELFVKTFGGELSQRVGVIAMQIVRKCGGLPLAIITMAKSMKGVNDLEEWQDVLTDMGRSIPRQQDMRKEVFPVLRHSYTRLNDPALKQCLLYCALFPEDYLISLEILIEYLLAEGIIDQEIWTRKQKYDKGKAMINKLIEVSLLEQVDGRVKMNRLIRDMAVQIMKENLPSIVEPARRLQFVPEEKYWRKDTVRVSLMFNDISNIPPDFSPPCPHLTTLFLSQNWSLNFIPDLFFDQLKGLKVVDISHTNIGQLPESFSRLRSLTALFANDSFLSLLPPLKNLKSLETLDLHDCRYILDVPIGLKSLTNLTFLDLIRTGILYFPIGILPWLPHLQVLAFDNASRNAGEIGRLQKLECLCWCFPSMRDLILLQSLLPMNEISYSLCVGGQLSEPGVAGSPRNLEIEWCWITGELSDLNFQIEALSLVRVSFSNGIDLSLCLQNQIGLRSFRIDGCDGLSYLFSVWTSPLILQRLQTLYVYNMNDLLLLFNCSEMVRPRVSYPIYPFALKELHITDCSVRELLPHGLLPNLRSLEIIEVRNCRQLEEIISVGENYVQAYWLTFNLSLPNLKSLTLFDLPRLRNICSRQIECFRLQFLCICNCRQLQNIPIPLPLPFLRLVRVWPTYWWETMMWDWAHLKYALPRLLFTTIDYWSLASEALGF